MERKLTRPRGTGRGGFALVLALSMMAFVIMLLLSMTLLVRVETSNSSQALAQLRAKESARLALMMALGDLQRYAGPDQRVTARAEILGSARATENPYWTGVWDTANPNATPRWMVSWQDQSTPTSAPPIKLLSVGTILNDPNQHVEVPAIEINGLSSNTIDEIAWWVSDEGVKASVGQVDHAGDLNVGFVNEFFPNGLPEREQKQLLKQISPRRVNTTSLLGSQIPLTPREIEDIRSADVLQKVVEANEEIVKLLSHRQLGIIEEIERTLLEQNFHNTTYLSKGVFTDTKLGGLKRDLTDQSYSDSSGALNIGDPLKSFLWNQSPDASGNLDLIGLEEAVFDNLQVGDIVNSTPPVITEFYLYFAISGQSKNSSTARAFLSFEAELWSPYGFRHNFQGASSSTTPELFVEIEGLPDVSLSFYDKDTEKFTSSSTLSFNSISPSFELDLTDTHKAGEIRKTTGIWPANASSNKKNFYYTNDWQWVVDDPAYNLNHRSVSFPLGDSIRYVSSNSTLTVTIKNSDGDILQRIGNIPYGSINTDFGFYEDTPTGLSSNDAPISFYYRLIDDRFGLEKLLTEIDPRSINLDASDIPNFELLDINDVDGDDQGDADIRNLAAFSNTDLFHGQINNNYYRLFDVPSAIPYSLGVLQHLQINGRRPFSIGNPWGETLNEVFDRFMISGIPQDSASNYWSPTLNQEENPLPNPYIELTSAYGKFPTINDVNESRSTRYILNKGNFNINSTSVKAWEAILSGNFIYDWDYTINKGTSSEITSSRLNLEAAFFRLPFSGHLRTNGFGSWSFPFEDFENEISLGDDYPLLTNAEMEFSFKDENATNPIRNWRPSLGLGHRELANSTVSDIANRIVENLKLKTRPFISIEEFITSGLIQVSIDETSVNTVTAGTTYKAAAEDEKIPRNATAYLSQADIISALAPKISPRSDTFKIRAYARSKGAVTNLVDSIAICEAIIQRVPDRMDGDVALAMQNADGLGRKFIIENIAWLNLSDL